MNIMDLFRTVPQQNQQTQGQLPPGQQNNNPMGGTQNTPQTANNGVVPSLDNPQGMQSTSGNQQEVTPFADFQKLWETDPNAPSNPNAPMFGNLDPKKLQEAASKVNFSGVITPEVMQKIQNGGAGAAEAFALAMNQVAQTVYAQSALATTKIVEQAVSKQREQFDSQLPSAVKRLSVNDNLRTENPLISNPAVAPMVGALQEQIIRKFPNATPGEVQTMVQGYLTEMGKAFAPQSQQSAQKGNAPAEEDWSLFFDPQ